MIHDRKSFVSDRGNWMFIRSTKRNCNRSQQPLRSPLNARVTARNRIKMIFVYSDRYTHARASISATEVHHSFYLYATTTATVAAAKVKFEVYHSAGQSQSTFTPRSQRLSKRQTRIDLSSIFLQVHQFSYQNHL